MSDPALKKLRTAADGLVLVSETDAPFEAFEWGAHDALTPSLVRELGGHAKRSKVAARDFRKFFEPLTQEQDWHEDEDKEQVRKYRELAAVVEKELTDATVYRVGETEVTYYVVGRSKAGNWVGVKAKAVET